MAVSVAVALGGILFVNPFSLVGFFYFAALFAAFIGIFHREQIYDFMTAFSVNSALISLFYIVQTTVYPDSFGTTSPLGSWTDDSFFFALVADSVPPTLVLRDFYFEYSTSYTDLLRLITLTPIHHPMDVIFFQSGIAGILTAFLKRYAFQLSGDRSLAKTAFWFATLCPFLLMNGGALLIRDTMTAALLIYSLSCLNKKQWPLAIAAIVLHIIIRPGTGILMLPLYVIVFLPGWKDILAMRGVGLMLGLAAALVIGSLAAFLLIDISQYQGYLNSIDVTGRELAELDVGGTSNQLLLAIQTQPFFIKFPLNGAYIFLYPFLSFDAAFNTQAFDLRSVLLGFVCPIESYWLNAWFLAGLITNVRAIWHQRQIGISVIISMLLIGTYSLQTRHKTIIYPIYYLLVSVGFLRARPADRRVGYVISTLLMVVEIYVQVR